MEIYEPEDELVPSEVTENQIVQTINERAIALLAEAHGLKIVDDESDARGVDIVLRAKSLRRDLSNARSDATTPYERRKKAIIRWFTAHDSPLESVERETGDQHLRYQARVREAARKEQERLQKLADARNAKAAVKAEAKGVEPPVMIPVPTVQAPPKTVKTAAGSLTVKTVWSFEVVDLSALPDEYKMADEAKLGRVVRAGVRQIPGVRIFETESLGGRS